MALSPNTAAALLAGLGGGSPPPTWPSTSVGSAPGCERFARTWPPTWGPVAARAACGTRRRARPRLPGLGHTVADLRDVNSALRSLLPAPAAALVGTGRALTEVAITSGTLGGASAGLRFGGLLLKGLAGVLLLAPVLVSDVSPFDGDAADVREPIVEVDEAASALARGAGPVVGTSADEATVPTITVVATTAPPDGEVARTNRSSSRTARPAPAAPSSRRLPAPPGCLRSRSRSSSPRSTIRSGSHPSSTRCSPRWARRSRVPSDWSAPRPTSWSPGGRAGRRAGRRAARRRRRRPGREAVDGVVVPLDSVAVSGGTTPSRVPPSAGQPPQRRRRSRRPWLPSPAHHDSAFVAPVVTCRR